MAKKYRIGMAEFRAAVKAALEVGASDKDVTDGRWWSYAPPLRDVVATDEAIDRVIECFSMAMLIVLMKGGMVSLQGFGTFFVGRVPARRMGGAFSGVSKGRKAVRFRASKAIQEPLGALPLNNGV